MSALYGAMFARGETSTCADVSEFRTLFESLSRSGCMRRQ